MLLGLELDVAPGVGVGPFQLGESLWHILNHVRNDKTSFPQAEVKWDHDSPTNTPIILALRHIDLLFSPLHQRLLLIAIRGLQNVVPPLTLRYKDQVISSSAANNTDGEVVLRRKTVAKTFGPTYAGDVMRYPGIWFGFDEDGEALGKLAHPSSGSAEDRMLQVRRVGVCQKLPPGQEMDTLAEVLECPTMVGQVARAIIIRHVGVVLHFQPPTPPVAIRLGETTSQDLSVDIGTPLRIYYKEDDRMTIHSNVTDLNEETGDYLFHYLQFGVDCLVSGVDHCVKKIVLHSNVPGSPMFGRHKRCPWEFAPSNGDGTNDHAARGPSFVDKIDVIAAVLSPDSQEKPPTMLYDRAEDETLALPSTTRLVGFDGLVLEVAESEHVLTVTLF